MLLPVAWEPRAGWAAGLAGLALWRPWLAAGLALPLAAVTRGLALPGALATHGSWREGAGGVAGLVILVPAALLAAGRSRPRALLAAAALLAFATPWLPDRSALAAPLAKSASTQASLAVAADNIQVHGGIGFTWEHPAHLYLRRALADGTYMGDARLHRELLVRRLGLD